MDDDSTKSDNLIINQSLSKNFNANSNIFNREKKKPFLCQKSIFEVTLYSMTGVSICVIIYLLILFLNVEKVTTIANNNEIPKPYNDSRLYSIIQLQNDIKITLISDVKSSISALSLTVGTGGFDDEDIPGLIHLTARLMVFRSNKYNRTIFSNYLSKYFGRFQMVFKDDETTFNFEVGINGFKTSLNIFGEMMSNPLFNDEIVEFGKRGIQSEYKYNSRQTNIHERQILNEIVFKDKMYFPNGNYASFSGYSDQQLAIEAQKIYDRHYYGANINIAVISNQNLKELKGMIIKAFQKIKKKPIYNNSKSNQDGTCEIKQITRSDLELGQLISYSHLLATNIHYHFYFDKRKDNQFNNNEKLMLHYLTIIFRDKSPKSIFAVLGIDKKVSSLNTKVEVIDKTLIHFTIEINYSMQRVALINDITDKLFNLIRILRERRPEIVLYNEFNTISMQNFNFKAFRQDYITYVTQLSHYMTSYENITNVFYGENYYPPYNETILSYYLSILTPENCIISYVKADVTTGKDLGDLINDESAFDSSRKKEQWYGLEYFHDALSNKAISKLRSINLYDSFLDIRKPNPFISKLNQSIMPDLSNEDEMNKRTPVKVIDVHHGKMWHKVSLSYDRLVRQNILYPKKYCAFAYNHSLCSHY